MTHFDPWSIAVNDAVLERPVMPRRVAAAATTSPDESKNRFET